MSRSPAQLDVVAEEARLRELVTDILAEARRQGASAAEVAAGEDLGLSVNVRLGEVETVEFNHDRGFGITVYFGQQKGSASTSDSSPQAILDAVHAACRIARNMEVDPHAGLAAAELMANSSQLPELDLFHPWSLDVAAAEALAVRCESAARADARIVNSDGASVNTAQRVHVYGNSHGFVGAKTGTRHSISCAVIAEDGQGMQRDFWYSIARDPGKLADAEAIGQEAARRTLARLGARPVRTGRYPVLFVPRLASGLFGHVLSALTGSAQYRQATFLLDSAGQKIMPTALTLEEQPHLPGAMGSAAFDADGVATWRKPFIEGGVVRHYVLSGYSGRRLGMATTGNAGGVHNLIVQGPQQPFAALLREMGTGLLVTELMGQGVNLVTGDYSRGVGGFWVEGGEIAYPVQEVTIAANLKDMIQGIVGLGDDVDWQANTVTGSVLIDAMTVAAA
jgi:PmbA protein